MSAWADGFIAVDWGTTNRRAYLIEDGESCAREFEDAKGILAIAPGGFETALAEIRDRLGDWPMLLAGMIGSNRGWIEAPYVRCPAGLEELARGLLRVESGREVIIPGVSYSNHRSDVMRGEEIQLLGAVAAEAIPNDCLVCHPGTHNKWVQVRDGRIHSFRTVMTGELFNLLKERSILSDLLGGKAAVDYAFGDGVRRALSGVGITAELFETRARFLLGELEQAQGASFVSGLLIGEDVRIGLGSDRDSRVIVMGRPELTGLYVAALEQAGVQSEQFDGERAFIAGACGIVELIG